MGTQESRDFVASERERQQTEFWEGPDNAIHREILHRAAMNQTFAESAMKAADAGRDVAVKAYNELRDMVIEHVGINVLEAWELQAARDRIGGTFAKVEWDPGYSEPVTIDTLECRFCGSTTGHLFNCGQGGGR